MVMAFECRMVKLILGLEIIVKKIDSCNKLFGEAIGSKGIVNVLMI